MWDFLIGIERKITNEYWDSLVVGYCKVEFLCHNGAPNWLGWIPLVFLISIFILFVIVIVIGVPLVFIGALFGLAESVILEIKRIFKSQSERGKLNAETPERNDYQTSI